MGRFHTSTHFKRVDTNSYIDYSSNHYRKWKSNIPYGQFRRVRKNCTSNTIFEEQAAIIRTRFVEKGYPKPLIESAYDKVKNISQGNFFRAKDKTTCRDNIKHNNNILSSNFVTTFCDAHPTIRRILNDKWFILRNDPILKDLIPTRPLITFRRAPTIKNLLAPSRLKQHRNINAELSSNRENGSFKCAQPRCKCCDIIKHNVTSFKSTHSKEIFPIKYNLTCQSQYVIYLVECTCGHQYVGRTIQKLHLRLNKHRSNIKKGFLQHSVSRHIFNYHPGINTPITITPIDYIPSHVQNRFEKLKNKETFWIYKLQTLYPKGLNDITEMVS